MAFKGTKTRTARQIAEEIEAVGGDLNAATSVESTAYYARVLRVDVPLALDVLSDILTNPTFEPEELAREKNVIVQEIGAVEDTPDDLIFEYLQGITFPDQPIGRSILGTPETVRSIDARRLRSYLARNYRAPDMVIAAAGAVDHQAIVADVEPRFGSFDGPEGAPPESSKFVGGHASNRAIWSRSMSPLHSKACRSAIHRSTACRSSPMCLAAECPRAFSRKCARSAGFATRSMPSMPPMRTPACSVSMPAPMRPTCRS